ncbi:MAG: hypothetical protein DRI89_11905 [Bacteroidetes bacterium]|nr:MAG: hypothetical protein DRI89_11905 [Bacteroidota bacterium]
MKYRLYKNLHGTRLSLIAIAFCFIPIFMFGQTTKNPRETTDLPSDPQHPMYGLNLYIPAWDEDYETNLNWYGSGDIDGNDTINMADYTSTVTSTDPFNDGNHRGDTDLDGDVDAADKAIIMNYINGGITHINKWELESETEKTNHLENALAIDPTSEIAAGSSGWLCGNYSNQTFINFNGVYDINNSIFANGNGTNLQYDLAHNGIFRIPIRKVNTKILPDIGHIINNVYLGDPNNQDATEFGNKIYFEPQSDVTQEPGDYSLNDYAEEKWYGYYEDENWGWQHGWRSLIQYDLDATPIVGSNIHPDLVTSWTPFDQVTYPNDSLHEFPGDTSVAVNGEPGNLYTGTVYSHSDVSTQTNDTTCTDVTYNVTRSWEGVAGAYDGSNTPLADHDQIIDVEDTTPPTADFESNIDLEYYVGIESTLNSSLFGPPTNIQDNSALPVDSTMVENNGQVMGGSCDQVNFVYSHEWDVNDVCDNNLPHSIEAYVSDNTAPVRDGDGNWTDNSGLEVLVTTDTVSTQNPDQESCEHYTYNYTVTETGTDVCGNFTDFEHEPQQVINVAPYRVPDTPVPDNDTIYVPLGGDKHPDSTGWAEWIDPEGGPVTKDYSDQLIEEDQIHRLYHRTQFAEDPCQSSTDTAYHYVYEHKPDGFGGNQTLTNLIVFPNPTNGEFSLHFNKTGQVKIDIYNLNGQLLKETVYEIHQQNRIIKMNISNQTEGIYILRIQGENGVAATVKILKSDSK